ncbi:ester cyclase [Nocardia sp. 348MFTsu5.1]|uniref:ester cyclase n=1 Tax=Nocardia sp. 348MFTsu5.1 TaxID=1172185 RepID=UPI000378A636|nr:ester cyclase [Nocardia sp. 348MFTsu5.1]
MTSSNEPAAGPGNKGTVVGKGTDLQDIAARSLEIMATGSLPDFEAVVHPDAVNREGITEPAATRGSGPAAFFATAQWLRGAFADLHHEIHESVTAGDLVVLHTTMTGRQVGPFVVYDENAAVKQAFPPTGRNFASTQTHWIRIRDGKVIEHWANRDDLTLSEQLGWIPPSPRYLIRMAIAKRKAAKGSSS